MKPNSIMAAASMLAHSPQSVVHRSILRSKFGSITLFAIDNEEIIPEHKSRNDEFLHVVEGEILLHLNDEKRCMKCGESQHIQPNTLHTVVGLESAKILLTIIKNK